MLSKSCQIFLGAAPWIKEVRMANSPGALGASAALNAIVLLDILLYPKRMVYLYMILPVPAALFGVVYVVGSMTGLLGVSLLSSAL
jgi:predicted RND superfamily exporter protein